MHTKETQLGVVLRLVRKIAGDLRGKRVASLGPSDDCVSSCGGR